MALPDAVGTLPSASHPPRTGPHPRRLAARPGWGLTELVVGLRWVALGLGVVRMLLGARTRAETAGACTLAAYALVRTLWPLRLDAGSSAERRWRRPVSRAVLEVLAELALSAVVVALTGATRSPFDVSLAAATFVVGLRVAPVALGAGAVAGVAAVVAGGVTGALGHPSASRDVERLVVLAAVAFLGSYSDWLLRTGRQERGSELQRLRGLGEVNSLLLELHAKAASLPASLNLKGAVTNTVSRLRELLGPDVVVLLLRDLAAEEERGRWHVTVAEGAFMPTDLGDDDLPPALRETMRSLGPLRRSQLDGEGVSPESCSGLYVPLWARGTLIGLMAVERLAGSGQFADGDLDIVESVARHAGLAIDNARWFRRLRILGAEEERGRIARELHDRLGQALAYVALSLDRLALECPRRAGTEAGRAAFAAELDQLAADVRRTAGEVRMKLSDLRFELGDEALEAALAGLLSRVQSRSGIQTSLRCEGRHRLPPLTEREVARIAQEAIHNAERHSGATRIDVRLRADGDDAVLEVVDDGRGIEATAPLRRDAYGILGMRERADAIGASLGIVSPPGKGTTVRLRVAGR